jgi:metal-sulfur cluster biosynthetic enzyme
MLFCMDEEMKRTIDSVLDRVKDPESGYSVSELGVVTRLRYNEEKKELYVFTDFASHQPGCFTCVGIAAMIQNSIQRWLTEEFAKELPGVKVVFV